MNYEPPKFATFETGKSGFAVEPKAAVNDDALPPMPSWETASSKRILTTDEGLAKEEEAMEMGRLDPATGQTIPLMSGAGRSPTASPGPVFNQTGPGRGQNAYMGPREMGRGQLGRNSPAPGGGPYGRGAQNGYNGNGRGGYGDMPGSPANGRGQGYSNGGQQFAQSPTGNQYGNVPYQSDGPNQGGGGAAYGRAQSQRQFSDNSNRSYGPPQRQMTGGSDRPFPAPQRQMTGDSDRSYAPQQQRFPNDTQGPPLNFQRQNTGDSYGGNSQAVNRGSPQNNNISSGASNLQSPFNISQSSRPNDNYRGTPPPQAQLMSRGSPSTQPPHLRQGFGGNNASPQGYASYSPAPMEVQQPSIPELGAIGANGAAYPGYKTYTPPPQQAPAAYRPPPMLMPGGGRGTGQPPRNWTPDNL